MYPGVSLFEHLTLHATSGARLIVFLFLHAAANTSFSGAVLTLGSCNYINSKSAFTGELWVLRSSADTGLTTVELDGDDGL